MDYGLNPKHNPPRAHSVEEGLRSAFPTGAISTRSNSTETKITPERWQRVKNVLEAALSLAPHERTLCLDRACAGDTALRAEVESLLAYGDKATGDLEGAVLNAAHEFTDGPSNEEAGRRIGPYRLVKEIGRGGMGSVYMA
ncbi:MAG: hypothetical protein ACRD7E_09220, partial [Bryobacteraceae bacterium]